VLRDLLSLVEEAQAELKPMVRGDTGQLGQLRWHVLAPPYVDVARASLSDRSNKSSIVLRLEVGPRGFLITGDIEGASAKRMAQLGGLSADVLLIPHHGADGTHLDDLLEATAPTYAIVSAGRTDDHHPTMTTLATVRDSSCVVMCTQANRFCHQGDLVQSFCAGTIRFRVAHGRLFVHPSRRTHERRIRSLDSPVCIDLPRQDISIVANHG
jgi:beta-lactamase superfamily II metal-dependent hydrolase